MKLACGAPSAGQPDSGVTFTDSRGISGIGEGEARDMPGERVVRIDLFQLRRDAPRGLDLAQMSEVARFV
jgi:hypothetical protein